MSAERLGRACRLALPLLLCACRASDELPRRPEPLAAHAGALDVERETVALDVGTPEARPYLVAGFGPDTSSEEGSSARIEGALALVRLELWHPRDRRLRLSAWGVPGGSRSVAVRLSLNGRVAGRLMVAARRETLELDLPRSLWRPGENLLRFETEPPGRPVGIAIGGLRFAGERDQPESRTVPRFDAEGDLVVPSGHAARLYLDLPKGAGLRFRRVDAGATGARLEIAARSERRPAYRLLQLASEAREGALELTPDAGGLVELAFRAVGGEAGELRVVAPLLELPPPAPTARAHARPARTPAGEPAKRPNLVIYLVDTLRADHLGCYGYPRPTSPALDAFAREAVLFRRARAQSSWTRAAVGSILTGLPPVNHQAQNTNERLSEKLETLAERLAAAGYQTAMITTNGNVTRRFGFEQGFEHFEYLREDESSPELYVLSDVVDSHAGRFLARRDPARPFFLVLHTSDPHDPYAPRGPFRSRLAPGVSLASGAAARLRALEERGAAIDGDELARIVALYDAEIAQNDAAFGELLARLERAGLAATTAVLFLSDHGEEFQEHGGWTHGKTLYEEMLRIPFVLRLPAGEGAGSRPAGEAEQIAVAPTLLALAGVAPPPGLPGRDLLPEIRGAPTVERYAYAWLARDGYRAQSVLAAGWKLIVRPGGPLGGSPYAELFFLASDPRERADLALTRDLRRGALEARLAAANALFAPTRPLETVRVGREIRRRLQALGYLR